MHAARLVAPETVELVPCEVPEPGAGEVVVRVLACGVCGSDLNAWRGVPGIEFPLPPGVPGHEVWGEVAAVGAGVDLPVGGRVTGMMQGGYAQYTLAAAEDLVLLPPDLADQPLLGEPLACAANIVRRIARQADEPVAFVGFGYIAALVAQLLFVERPGRWVAISRRPESRAMAERLGAAAVHPYDAVPGELWDSFPIVVEATGVQAALDHATWLTAYGGRLVIAGYHADGPRTVNMQSWNWKGIDVVNAHERDPRRYVEGLRRGLDLVARHRLRPHELVSHRWPLAGVAQALAAAQARRPDYVKGLVLPWES